MYVEPSNLIAETIKYLFGVISKFLDYSVAMNENNNGGWSHTDKNNIYESHNHGSDSFGEFSFANIKRHFTELIIKCRQSRSLVLLVVFIALFFDNMLLTTVGK